MSEHAIAPAPETVQWGFFDAAQPPALTVDDGAMVRLTALSGGPDDLPPPGFPATISEAYRAVHAGLKPGAGPHLLTGPVAVRGAEPGDALRVEILDVALADDWGFNLMRPLAGALPDDFDIHRRVHFSIDQVARVVRTPWGVDIPAKPFFGVMGVAPPAHWGRQTSIIPRRFGGNIDCTELGAGAVLHLPVFAAGALFAAGDGHAAQGDGEVCLTAVETGLTGLFRLSVVKAAAPALPWAETPTHLIAFGFDPDLDRAARMALRAMIAMMRERTTLSAEDAYRLCSLCCDMRITQLVNQHKGVHAMLPRWALDGEADRSLDRSGAQ